MRINTSNCLTTWFCRQIRTGNWICWNWRLSFSRSLPSSSAQWGCVLVNTSDTSFSSWFLVQKTLRFIFVDIFLFITRHTGITFETLLMLPGLDVSLWGLDGGSPFVSSSSSPSNGSVSEDDIFNLDAQLNVPARISANLQLKSTISG